MGRKKTTGETGKMQWRATVNDRNHIATLSGRLAAVDGEQDNTRAIRYALKLSVELGIELIGEVGGGRECWHEYEKPSKLPVTDFAGSGVVAYRVRGDSMIDVHIVSGDYVLVRKQNAADHGAKVVAWIRDAGGVVKLYDANKGELYSGKGKDRWAHKMADGDMILGVYVGVWRKG